MLTLYHSPQTRSTRIVRLLHELGALDRVEVKTVGIRRGDGSGGEDAANPHPEGKVPLLVHDGALVRESNAIILYLTELFPEAGLGPMSGDPERGAYLSWLAYYGNVVEPVMVLGFAGADHPALRATFRGPEEMARTLAATLEKQPYLLGENYSAADLLLSSPFTWMPSATPDNAAVKAWIERCEARPSKDFAAEYDAKAMQAAAS
ncbi:glutathione S-transferase family protein [Oceaniglobus roseus]|uniref:glutathione S-transferase family protein n=1 Tax=Oceaniglobus roseus TaxID=1737570 RepID=UPI000C7E8D58|nr:glutathione S-transferase family protein [Kandeliimicrobium roseum]